MYLHIGADYQLNIKHIVAILDIDNLTRDRNQISLEFLDKLEKDNKLIVVSVDLPRSLILTKNAAYLSPIAPSTLLSRMGY